MGGYIFFRPCGGFCDSLYTLQTLISYAKKYDRVIILDLVLYSASDLEELLDFSVYPVKIICKRNAIREIIYDNVEPSCFNPDIFKRGQYVSQSRYEIDGQQTVFDLNKEYPNSTLLVYYNSIGGPINMSYLRFTKFLLDAFYKKLSLLPKKFDSVHLRATDHYEQKPEEDMKAVRNFVKNKKNVYLATDNMRLMESLSEEFPQIIRSFSYKKIDRAYGSLHQDYGKVDPESLKNALLDILVCASSEEFLPSVGGFSRLIGHLHANKELLKKLLQQ